MIDYLLSYYFFFFKQKTAYEMRISDWSSDVCSSDLLPLYHSWPLFECGQRFNLDQAVDWAVPDLSGAPVLKAEGQEFARRGIGLWECDLADNSLTWSNEVYDIFGLPRGACVSREETLALYCDESRRSEEHTSELQSLMRSSYAVFCLKK